ncbi:unnamed protein product, partial [Brenthis ino]
MSSNIELPPHILELQKQFSVIEDINDPTLIDTIITYLEQIQAEDENFFETLVEKRHEMIVTWEQPWYQQSNRISRPLKEPDNDDLEKFRTDTICLEESNKIHKNWKKFRKIFGIPNKPECLARWRNKDKSKNPNAPEEFVRRFVIAFLARGLERTLHQVYKHVIVRYGSPVKGAYLEYEDNIMNICLRYYRKNTVPDLSAILGREPRGLYKKFLQKMNGTRERKKLRWTLPLATKFLNLLMKYSNETLDNLINKRFEKSIWLKLEEDFDQNYICLQLFWYRYLHVQLFVKYDVTIRKLRKITLKKLRHRPYKVWGDIRWKEILKEFPEGFTHLFLYRICGKVFNKYPGYRKDPIQDVIEYGLRKTKSIRNKRLKTLVLNKDKELEVIKYEDKLCI